MNYLSQIPKLHFKPVTPKIFRTIQYEGLDEETGEMLMSQWNYAELKISPEDQQGLKRLNPLYINKFNQFDIALKNKYKLHIVDLIDYDEGRIILVRRRR